MWNTYMFHQCPMKPVGKIGEELVFLLSVSIALYDLSLKVLKSWKDLHSCFAGYIEMKDVKVLAPCRHECLLIIMYTLWLLQYIRNVFVFLPRSPFKPFDFVPVCGGQPSLSSPGDYLSHDAFRTLWPYPVHPFPVLWASSAFWIHCLSMFGDD